MIPNHRALRAVRLAAQEAMVTQDEEWAIAVGHVLDVGRWKLVGDKIVPVDEEASRASEELVALANELDFWGEVGVRSWRGESWRSQAGWSALSAAFRGFRQIGGVRLDITVDVDGEIVELARKLPNIDFVEAYEIEAAQIAKKIEDASRALAELQETIAKLKGAG